VALMTREIPHFCRKGCHAFFGGPSGRSHSQEDRMPYSGHSTVPVCSWRTNRAGKKIVNAFIVSKLINRKSGPRGDPTWAIHLAVSPPFYSDAGSGPKRRNEEISPLGVVTNGAERRGLCDHQEFGAGDQTGWLGN
jgi:hypothetical protein